MVLAGGRQVLQILGGEASNGNMQACKGKPLLFLRMDAVVRARLGVEHRARIRGQGTEQLLDLAAEGVMADLVEVEAEAAFRALVSLTVIAPEADDRVGHFADLVGLHPGIEGNGIGVHLRGQNATDPDAKTHHTVFFNGMENDVVVQEEVVLCTCNSCIPLPRKVGILGIALTVVGQEILKLRCVRPGVDNLLGVDPGDGIPRNVARIVKAGLDGAQTRFFEALENFRQVSQENTTQLKVLSRRDVAAAVLSVAFNDRCHNAHLLSAEDAVRHPEAQHEFAWCLWTPEHAVPLQTKLQIGFIDLFPSEFGETLDFAANQQAILLGFVLFDLVELFTVQVWPGWCADGHDL